MASKGDQKLLQAPCLIGLHDNHNKKKQHAIAKHEGHWNMIMDKDDDNHQDAYMNMPSSSSSLGDSSTINSNGSTSSSSDLVDDASSSSPPSSNSYPSSNGPLFEFSDLMAQLPIKRGLSNFFQGKSQSFTSLSRVKSIEDLAKKESPFRKKMKTSKSYGGGLDSHKSYALDPKATISKRSSRSSFSPLSVPGRRSTFLASNRPPPPPVQKHF